VSLLASVAENWIDKRQGAAARDIKARRRLSRLINRPLPHVPYVGAPT
jgi:hypothetical protein